jgi:hypothetical protein
LNVYLHVLSRLNFFQETAQYLYLPVTDINGYSNIGFMQGQTTTKDGRRFSTAKAFLKPGVNAIYKLHMKLRGQNPVVSQMKNIISPF